MFKRVLSKNAEDFSFPQAILFDWDNTLIESWGVIHESMNRTFVAFGLRQWSREETENRVRASLRDSFPELFGDRWRDAEKVFYESFSAIHLDYLRPVPEAQEMLEVAKERGLYLSVVSNKRGEFLRKEATHLGWAHYFKVLAGAGDAKKDKPAPDHVYLALGKEHVPSHKVWFIGDTDIDLRCAVASGCLPVLLRKKEPEPGEFEGHAPRLYFRDCQELLLYLQNR